MDPDGIWIQLTAIIGLLGLSAFFSSVESAYFSLSRSTIDRLRDSADPRAKRVGKLLDDPRRLLATILTGNTLVNTIAAAIATLLAAHLALTWKVNPNLLITLEILLLTVIILFLSELFPKLLALRHPEEWAKQSSLAVWWFCQLFTPIALPFSYVTLRLSSLLGIQRHNVLGITDEEIDALVEVGHDKGLLEDEERELIHSIFEFGDTIVREVMIPRIDMVAVEKGVSFDELVRTVISKGHSRIPVYDRDIDHITGIIHAKDLLSHADSPKPFDLEKRLHKILFAPEEKKIGDLLRELQREKVHMAIVFDEYGGTSGLITLEDILEEIVGEILDEYDLEIPLFVRKDDRTVIVDGKIAVDELNKLLEEELLSEDEAYDTVAGFMFNQLGVVPVKGQKLSFKGYLFIVEEVLGRRIRSVKIIKEKDVFENA